MRFSRHAKNRIRLYGLTRMEAEAIAATPARRFDDHGNPIHEGETAAGRAVAVVVALDAPDFVITLFERK